MDKQQKPELTLLSGKNTLDAEAILEMFRKLTGREPTAEEVVSTKKKIEDFNNGKK